MYFKRLLPVFSGIYRPLAARRYVMMTMGGYWPVIQRLHDGKLGVVTRDGDFHVGERGRLVFLTSPDGGESWSHATLISADGPDNRNPAFGVAADGTLLACFVKMDRYTDGILDRTKDRGGYTPLYICRSVDGGASWSRAELLQGQGQEVWSGAGKTGPDSPHRIAGPYGKMVTLPDGTILLGYHVSMAESPPHSAAFVLRSQDGGRTWVEPATVGEGLNEFGLCHLGDGHLLAVLRSDDEGSLYQSDSYDNGYTWSERRQLTSPGEHPADVIRLRDGRLLLTYGYRKPPFGVHGLLSRDDGRTWDGAHKLLLVADGGTDLGYPSSVQRDDGTIVTVYYSSQLHISGRRPPEILGVHGAALLYRPEDLP